MWDAIPPLRTAPEAPCSGRDDESLHDGRSTSELGSGHRLGALVELPAASPLWAAPNVLITPHSAGETRRYEDNVIDLLMDNLGRLWRGEETLKNQIV